MKRFKEMATIFLFALLAAGFTSSAMAASGSVSPWDFVYRFTAIIVVVCIIALLVINQPVTHYGLIYGYAL